MAGVSPRMLWTLIGSLVLILSALATMAVYGSLPHVPSRVAIGDWVVGGMPAAELERQLHEKVERLMNQTISLTIKPGGNGEPGAAADFTLKQLGLVVGEQQMVEQLRPIREGSAFRKAVYKWRIRGQQWSLERGFNEETLKASLQKAFPQVYARLPANAQRIIHAEDTIGYAPDVRVERLDEAALVSALEAILPSWGSPRWAGDDLCGPAGEGGGTGANSGASGQKTPSLPAPLKIIEPQLTVQMLQAQGIVRKISEFSTFYPPSPSSSISSEGRVHNVQSTAASIQDVLLKPGDVFDYAPYVEKTEKTCGYKEAPVIINGKLVPGIGGGICQVSSTLYNAVLRAGLEIVERRNHSLPVSYVPLGQDATFASGYINFKFRNNTQHYLLIRTATDARGMSVKLFGQTPPDITYEVESKTVQTLQPPAKYVLNPALPAGKKEVISKGKPGYIVETYRIKKQNGVVVSTEKISRDTYSAQPTIIASNNNTGSIDRTAPGPGNTAPLIEDGIRGPNFR
ncbi:hypothetical protein PAESOLCIP111_03495 [Paenibacillus solanacearum]|uniref:G5 domain-containing protein n=1 Tax=Paenibacillus solanacearum TaxID=2048548 RepID=A0A916K659_9BACL|nr:VanW family protein [Paenibacillus solanacearum]CAG7633735.1 hypothetical protein PAESOLCIP111_03495 [Paenibacillus solanacearum]